MYFPKSQTTTDLYTNGTEFVYINSVKEYVGYYFKTSSGKYYTGKNPNDPPIKEIIVPNTNRTEDAEEGAVGSYNSEANLYLVPDVYAQNQNLRVDDTPPKPPTQYNSTPTKENYELGEYQRYFTSKQNEINYTEISLKEFNQFQNQEPVVDFTLYFAFAFPWLIAGKRNDVININKKTIERIQNKYSLISFSSYFKGRYDQYFKYPLGSNLKTDGSEFLIKETNRPYTGLYHIHPTKGPMVGAEHTNIPHSFLIPISGSNLQYKISKTETQSSNRISGY